MSCCLPWTSTFVQCTVGPVHHTFQATCGGRRRRIDHIALGESTLPGRCQAFVDDGLNLLGRKIDHLAIAVRFEAALGQSHWRCVSQPPCCDVSLLDDPASRRGMFLGLLSVHVPLVDEGQDERLQHALAMVRSAAEGAFPRLPDRKPWISDAKRCAGALCRSGGWCWILCYAGSHRCTGPW